MANFKKALTALAAAAVLAPTLVACSGSNDKIVTWTNQFGGEMLVNCDKETVKILGDDAPDGFFTPEKLAAEVVRQATKDGNAIGAALGGPVAQGMAENALEGACSADVELTEPNNDGIREVKPPVADIVARGSVGGYKDGIQVSVKDAMFYEWIKAANMFSDRVVAPAGQKLLVVDLDISNDGKAPATLSGRTFQIVDSEGRRFDAVGYDSDVSLCVSETRQSDVSEYTSVNPGSKVTETLVFFVPADATGLALADRTEYVFNF